MSSKSTNDGDPNGGGNNQANNDDDDNSKVTAQQALDHYLDDKSAEYSSSTIRSHKSRLGYLVQWFSEETDYQWLSELRRADVLDYKQWRFVTPRDVQNDDELTQDDAHSIVTIKTQMDTVRGFLHWAQAKGLAQQDIHVSAESPDIENGANVATRFVDPQRVKQALEYLREYEWGQRQTVVLQLAWETAMRRGTIRGLDVDDWHPDEQYIEVRHRPPETPLKNKEKGERDVAVSDETASLIDAWVSGPRPDETDEQGREPLITTEHGRVSTGCVQTDVYDALRPARIGNDCGCDGDGCNANGKGDAYKCVGSAGPHAVRSTSITHHLNQGWPIDYLSDRVNCSAKVIEKHYDEATETEKMERRRDFVDDL
jgi:integrase